MNTMEKIVRYSHNGTYCGRNLALYHEVTEHKDGVRTKKTVGYRMTLRIEQQEPGTYLVTRAVCSPNDNFVKSRGRQLVDLRAEVHQKCLANSHSYYSKPLEVNLPVLIDGAETGLLMSVTGFTHIDHSRHKSTNLAEVITFTTSNLDSFPDSRELEEIIMDAYYAREAKATKLNYS